MTTDYRQLGGMMYAAIPLAERLDLWGDVAEHNRKAQIRAERGRRKVQPAPDRARRGGLETAKQHDG